MLRVIYLVPQKLCSPNLFSLNMSNYYHISNLENYEPYILSKWYKRKMKKTHRISHGLNGPIFFIHRKWQTAYLWRMTPATSAISHGLKGQLFSLISMVSPLMQRINLPLFRDSAMTCNKGTVTGTHGVLQAKDNMIWNNRSC